MRFKVVEQRMYESTYIIEADDERAAGRLEGQIISEGQGDSWGYDLVSVRQLDDEDGDE